MAGNPRKFSEKIALHLQKQAEEKQAFEDIMKEVSGVASRVCDAPTSQQQPSPNMKSKQQGNLLTPMAFPSYRGGSLPNVNQMAGHHGEKGQQGGPMFAPRSSSPRASSRNSIGPVKVVRQRADHAPYASPPSLSMLSGSMQHGNSGSNLHSPGGSSYTHNYLIPPMDGQQWGRAKSDSAINSRMMPSDSAINSLMIPSVVPDSSEESSNNSNDPRDLYGTLGQSPKHHQNDLSSVIPSTVGDGPSLLEIPNSVSTGSLPDLTTFQFTPPLQPPIDTEDSHSPYSTSPLSATYSPTGGSPHPPGSNSQQQQHSNIGNQRLSHGGQSSHQQHQQQQQQHPHQSQNQQGQLQSQLQNQQSQSFQQVSQQVQQQQQLDNPLNVNTSFQNFSNENMLTAYRCPQRPSPLNSPQPFRSPSPLDGQLSAPSSPAAQPTMTQDTYFLSQQAQALQQHFEQISMLDRSGSPQRNTSWQGGGMISNQNYYFKHGQQQIQTGATAGVTQQSPQNHQPQTPQTPSSIPDIIFTDFSDVRSEPFDDLLATEAAQALREGLGPIDIDELNMLADSGFVQLDPQAEDTFRLDKL